MVNEKNAHADTTIKATGKKVRHLELDTNLNNPEQVNARASEREIN